MPIDWLAILAIMVIGVAVIALGWEHTPVPLTRTGGRRREKGLRGVVQGLDDELRGHLMAQVGGDLPEGVTPQRFLALILLAMTGTILLLLWMGFGGIALIGGGVAGYIAATAYANAAAKKRQKKLNSQVLAAAEIMQDVILATGNQAIQVLADVAKKLGNPLYEEVGPLISKAAAGDALVTAITEMQDKVAGSSSLLIQLLAVFREIYRPTEEGRISPDKQARMVGGFLEQAEYETELERDVEVLASPGRTTRWLVVAIIVGILLFQFLVQPDTMRNFISTTFGQISMVIVLLLILAVIVVGERIAKVD